MNVSKDICCLRLPQNPLFLLFGQCPDFHLDTFLSCPIAHVFLSEMNPVPFLVSPPVNLNWSWQSILLALVVNSDHMTRCRPKGQKRTLETLENDDALSFREHSIFSCFMRSPYLLARVPFHHMLEGMLYFPAVCQQGSMGPREAAGSHLVATERTRLRIRLT